MIDTNPETRTISDEIFVQLSIGKVLDSNPYPLRLEGDMFLSLEEAAPFIHSLHVHDCGHVANLLTFNDGSGITTYEHSNGEGYIKSGHHICKHCGFWHHAYSCQEIEDIEEEYDKENNHER